MSVYQAIDKNTEDGNVVIDISKNVWRVGLLQELKGYGVSGGFFSLILSSLLNHQTKLILNGFLYQCGDKRSSIFGPIFLLLFINKHFDVISSQLSIYTDDITIYSRFNDQCDRIDKLKLRTDLENDLRSVDIWAKK